MKEVEKIFKNLGGIRDYLDEEKNLESDIVFFEKSNDVLFPDFFRNFIIKYAPFSFNKLVKKSVKNRISSFIDGNLTVDYFYSFNVESKQSIQKLLAVHEQQIPYGFIPFCDGESGDLICICLNADKYGEIYYFHHEAKNENLIKINSSFKEFLDELIIQTDEPQNVKNWRMPESVKKNSTKEFIKMLEEWKSKNR